MQSAGGAKNKKKNKPFDDDKKKKKKYPWDTYDDDDDRKKKKDKPFAEKNTSKHRPCDKPFSEKYNSKNKPFADDKNKEKTKPCEVGKFIHKPLCCKWHKFCGIKRVGDIVQRKRTPLRQDISKCIASNEVSNVRVLIGKEIYKCNVTVLHYYCFGLVTNVKTGMMFRLRTCKVTRDAFKLIQTWMTNNRCYCQPLELIDMLIAAQFMGMHELICYLWAYYKNVKPLTYLMFDRVSDCFLIIVATKQFRKFQIDQVCQLLASNYISVQTEIEIFYAAVIWLFVDYKNRRKFLRNLFRVVRFKLLPTSFLLDWSERLHELPVDMADELCPLLYAAMVYHHEVHIRSYAFNYDLLPRHRNWIRDSQCLYLKLLDKNLAHNITLKNYLNYLRAIFRNQKSFMSRIVAVNYKAV